MGDGELGGKERGMKAVGFSIEKVLALFCLGPEGRAISIGWELQGGRFKLNRRGMGGTPDSVMQKENRSNLFPHQSLQAKVI